MIFKNLKYIAFSSFMYDFLKGQGACILYTNSIGVLNFVHITGDIAQK